MAWSQGSQSVWCLVPGATPRARVRHYSVRGRPPLPPTAVSSFACPSLVNGPPLSQPLSLTLPTLASPQLSLRPPAQRCGSCTTVWTSSSTTGSASPGRTSSLRPGSSHSSPPPSSPGASTFSTKAGGKSTSRIHRVVCVCVCVCVVCDTQRYVDSTYSMLCICERE